MGNTAVVILRFIYLDKREKKTCFVFQAWLNEMYTYDPETYHPSLMHSVYVTLDGPWIQLDYPRNNIPWWATFNEPFYDQSFTHSRRFHLDGSKVCAPHLIMISF